MATTIYDASLASVVVVRDTEEQFAVVTEERQVVISEGTMGPPGGRGEKGDKGDRGLDGAPGVSGASYVHDQAVASDVWVVDHGLGRFPAIVTVDSAGDEVEGSVRYDSANRITVTFSAPFGGKAYIN